MRGHRQTVARLAAWGPTQLLAATLLAACPSALEPAPKSSAGAGAAQATPLHGERLTHAEATRYTRAHRVLQSRCIVCHGCYDAPCQLKLDQQGGLARGATTRPVYDSTRLRAARPTRLGIDAHSVRGWRELGFFTVLPPASSARAQAGGVLLGMLELKRQHPLPTDKLLPEAIPIGLDREQVCADSETFPQLREEHPLWGMPYGLPGLSKDEHEILHTWVSAGASAPRPAALPTSIRQQVEQWESFLNGDDLRSQLVARYIYEHLFLATVQLRTGADVFDFRLVRSRTPPGQSIEEIATRRPFEDPGVERPYYRLRRRVNVRLSKTYMPYRLDAERMKHWRELFFPDDAHALEELPGYDDELAANPFRVFAALPVRARYRFMLEESEFTLMGFIKGPVCRGQVALDVIRDHFWVTFVDPSSPIIEAEDEFLSEYSAHLTLPAESGSNSTLAYWLKYARHQEKFLKAKSRFLEQLAEEHGPPTIEHVWDGDGNNPNASLTVFRHFDSASVTQGLVGRPPKTSWILGYAVLERIHYLLVAGFDVFGNLGHQLNTRLFMDFLRMEAEHNFLLLLPKKARKPLVSRWYQGVSDRVKDEVYGRTARFRTGTGLRFLTDDPQRELYGFLRARVLDTLPARWDLARVQHDELRRGLQHLQTVRGKPASHLPELSFLYVSDAAPDEAHYTLVHHSSHTNVAHLFREQARRVQEDDYVSVLPGFLGAYPNAFFRVTTASLADFAARAGTLGDAGTYEALMDDYGVRRTAPDFWQHSDTVHEARTSIQGPEAGLLDYNRLENR